MCLAVCGWKSEAGDVWTESLSPAQLKMEVVKVKEGGEEEEEVEAVWVKSKSETESPSPLSPSWGIALPPSNGKISASGCFWRPWGAEEVKVYEKSEPLLVKKWGNQGRKSPSAAARSRQRLLEWHEMKEPQLGPSRLQVQMRSSTTPLGPAKERRKVKLFGGEDSQEPQTGVSNGQQVEHHLVGSLWKNSGGFEGGLSQNLSLFGSRGRRETESSLGGDLHAGILSHFSKLQQIPPSLLAESIFPTPPPPKSWSARWRGDWWLIPAGMLTSCAACRQWGPLTP